MLSFVHTFARSSFRPSALRPSALHAIRNIDVEESNQNIGGDAENDVQGCQSLEVIISVTLQPIYWYGDDAVEYKQRGDQEMFF
jgi:hypothetical protein